MPSKVERIIELAGAGKKYSSSEYNGRALVDLIFGNTVDSYKSSTEGWALEPIDLQVNKGEVLGVIGRNGAGKSTLLKLISGTLQPTCGKVKTHGRVAALLELGAGFNPEFTGRENIYFNASLMGMGANEIQARISDIIDFSGIKNRIDNKVKTYSSGMYVRLAFSIATSIEPDLLIIDEALSVGDGEFASKSFERIMDLRNRGVAIVFCSHSMYQVQALSTRAIWIEAGRLCATGSAIDVITSYEESQSHENKIKPVEQSHALHEPHDDNNTDTAKITSIEVGIDGDFTAPFIATSGISNIEIKIAYSASESLSTINIATGFVFPDGRIASSVATHFTLKPLKIPPSGQGSIVVQFPKIPLLKGVYWIGAYLFCKDGIHVYDRVHQGIKIVITQNSLEQGFVRLPHNWISD